MPFDRAGWADRQPAWQAGGCVTEGLPRVGVRGREGRNVPACHRCLSAGASNRDCVASDLPSERGRAGRASVVGGVHGDRLSAAPSACLR